MFFKTRRFFLQPLEAETFHFAHFSNSMTTKWMIDDDCPIFQTFPSFHRKASLCIIARLEQHHQGTKTGLP